ncbi:hypothetical protein BB561_005174 [Smittium simulii]|uniref:Uncharacterized protein n=1 Tax=Smittium simulii TaxID=133385 RepID=A0A2T9YBQ5_9FUNG|nr:hypothetical protein BB561_005174 [Smittium simulii]
MLQAQQFSQGIQPPNLSQMQFMNAKNNLAGVLGNLNNNINTPMNPNNNNTSILSGLLSQLQNDPKNANTNHNLINQKNAFTPIFNTNTLNSNIGVSSNLPMDQGTTQDNTTNSMPNVDNNVLNLLMQNASSNTPINPSLPMHFKQNDKYNVSNGGISLNTTSPSVNQINTNPNQLTQQQILSHLAMKSNGLLVNNGNQNTTGTKPMLGNNLNTMSSSNIGTNHLLNMMPRNQPPNIVNPQQLLELQNSGHVQANMLGAANARLTPSQQLYLQRQLAAQQLQNRVIKHNN